MAPRGVRRREVEVQLTRMFGIESAGLELRHDVAPQAGVVEEQVDEGLLPADLQTVLAANEC